MDVVKINVYNITFKYISLDVLKYNKVSNYEFMDIWINKIKIINPDIKILGANINSIEEWNGFKTKLLIIFNDTFYDTQTMNHLCYRKFGGNMVLTQDNCYYYLSKSNPNIVNFISNITILDDKTIKCDCIKNHSFTRNLKGFKESDVRNCPICTNNVYVKEYLEEQIYKIRDPEITGIKLRYVPDLNKGKNTKLPLICKYGDEWDTTTIDNFVNKKYCCPICSERQQKSRPVLEIKEYLSNNNIKFIMKKRFDDCKNKQALPFDFYLQEQNICIEYDGIQHFKAVEHWGGEEYLKIRQNNDQIKNQYCKDNNIRLIRIRYDEDPKEILLREGIIT